MVNSAVPRQLRPRDPNTGAVVSSSIVEAAKTRSTVSRTSRPSGTSMSSVLQARSESVRPKRRSQSATAITAPKSPMPDIDSQDKDNYLCETGYVQDIYSYFRAVENRFCVCPYMDRQPDINDKMRAILIDWLVEVHLKFRVCCTLMMIHV